MSIICTANARNPTPISLARELHTKGEAAEGSEAALVLKAAAPWIRSSHELFPVTDGISRKQHAATKKPVMASAASTAAPSATDPLPPPKLHSLFRCVVLASAGDEPQLKEILCISTDDIVAACAPFANAIRAHAGRLGLRPEVIERILTLNMSACVAACCFLEMPSGEGAPDRMRISRLECYGNAVDDEDAAAGPMHVHHGNQKLYTDMRLGHLYLQKYGHRGRLRYAMRLTPTGVLHGRVRFNMWQRRRAAGPDTQLRESGRVRRLLQTRPMSDAP